MLNLGDIIPNFEAESTIGTIQFHNWLGNSWGILFSHPNDFTPVCTTELARLAALKTEFDKREIKIIALSCNSVDSHLEWTKDILFYGKLESLGYPIIADPDRTLSVQLGMIDPFEKDSQGMPLTCRAVFIIDHNKRLRLSILYPATTGRNFNEILRVVDSLKLTENCKVATPVDWQNGEQCMVLPTIKDDEVDTYFPKGYTKVELPSKKSYLRITPQPI